MAHGTAANPAEAVAGAAGEGMSVAAGQTVSPSRQPALSNKYRKKFLQMRERDRARFSQPKMECKAGGEAGVVMVVRHCFVRTIKKCLCGHVVHSTVDVQSKHFGIITHPKHLMLT